MTRGTRPLTDTEREAYGIHLDNILRTARLAKETLVAGGEITGSLPKASIFFMVNSAPETIQYLGKEEDCSHFTTEIILRPDGLWTRSRVFFLTPTLPKED